MEVFDWPKNGKLTVPILNKVSKASLLAAPGHALDVTSSNAGIEVGVPYSAPDPIASVIVLDLDGPIQIADLPPSSPE